MELKGSHVMITGANRGIGRAFAKVCAEDKAHLHIVIRKKDAELVKELESAGAASVTQWHADFADRSSLEKLVRATENLRVDLLFNNAGIAGVELFEKQDLEIIYELAQINLTSVMHLTRAFLPGMIKRKRGKIINNSSVLAVMHMPHAAAYSATKAAVMAFTQCLRTELRGSGVTTLLLLTPPIKTRMLEKFEKGYQNGFEIPMKGLTPQVYAKMIREAVLHDLQTVEPQGLTGLGVRVAKYIPQIFDWEVRRRFARGK